MITWELNIGGIVLKETSILDTLSCESSRSRVNVRITVVSVRGVTLIINKFYIASRGRST